MKIKTSSPQQTKKLGERLARRVLRSRPGRGAKIIALAGDLGSGKTTFTQGFARALGVRSRIMSPTFILIRRSKLRGPRYKNFYHIDAYRLKKPEEFLKLGLREILHNPQSIVLIEWADKLRPILPQKRISLQFRYGESPDSRSISVE